MFFTRNGDDGTTGHLGKGRLKKTDARIEAVGTLDECAAVLGVARSLCKAKDTAETILHIQRDLHGLMAEVSASPRNAAQFHLIGNEQVAWLEDEIEAVQAKTSIPDEFIVSGDTTAGAFLDLARTIVRRAERRVAALYFKKMIANPEILRYLNRLSSLCFVLELYENAFAGIDRPTQVKT